MKKLTLAHTAQPSQVDTRKATHVASTLMPFTEIKTSVSRLLLAFSNSQPLMFRSIGYSLGIAVIITISGCAGRPLEIKDKVDLPHAPGIAARAESSGVSILAEVIRDEDFLNDVFDANLILAGVLPVRLKATNQGQEPIDLSKARFEIKSSNGRGYKSAEAKKAFKRLISYYEISTYSKSGYKESQDTFINYALDLTKPLGGGESREGLVFFIVPDTVAQVSGLKMTASRLDRKGGAVELDLN